MFAGLPSLSHEQQQKAVERIHELMSQGMSSGEAITRSRLKFAPLIPANGSWRVLKTRTKTSNARYTAAIILISTLYFGFINPACTVQRTGA